MLWPRPSPSAFRLLPERPATLYNYFNCICRGSPKGILFLYFVFGRYLGNMGGFTSCCTIPIVLSRLDACHSDLLIAIRRYFASEIPCACTEYALRRLLAITLKQVSGSKAVTSDRQTRGHHRLCMSGVYLEQPIGPAQHQYNI